MVQPTRCSNDECDRSAVVRGLCRLHYDHFYKSELFTPAYPALRAKSMEQRFWAKVKTDGPCWLWQGAVAGSLGYGQFRNPGHSTIYAHRVSWELAFGPIPNGALVLHRCDVPRCVRPEHLYLGDAADNMRDRIASERIRSSSRAEPVGTMVVSIRVPKDILTKADEIAEHEHLSRSAVFREAVNHYHGRIFLTRQKPRHTKPTDTSVPDAA